MLVPRLRAVATLRLSTALTRLTTHPVCLFSPQVRRQRNPRGGRRYTRVHVDQDGRGRAPRGGDRYRLVRRRRVGAGHFLRRRHGGGLRSKRRSVVHFFCLIRFFCLLTNILVRSTRQVSRRERTSMRRLSVRWTRPFSCLSAPALSLCRATAAQTRLCRG